MIRTHIIECHLKRAEADALNQASGAIYTQTLITHYRVYRKRGRNTRHWLSQFAAMRLNDYLTRDDPPLLHAHSKDAAQEAFYKACKTAKANRALRAPPTIKHRMPHNLRLMRRCRDTGQPTTAVARGTARQPREAAALLSVRSVTKE